MKTAEKIVARARTGQASIESVEAQTRRLAPPQLYDLTELQRAANRIFGWSATRTLEVAQSLYESKKVLSYPRTDSRHLSTSVAATLPKIVRAISGPYLEKLAAGTGERPLGARFVDDAKVSDHHAIIPTGHAPAKAGLSADEARLFDLVARRLLAAWHADHVYATTTVVTAIANVTPEPITDRYRSQGSSVVAIGWRALEGAATGDGEALLPSGLARGQAQDVVDARAERKRTRPPRRLTEATLLTAMETAGRTLEDRELSEAMRETGLGTPATRASIIETLLERKYITRDGKALAATDKGVELIEIVHPDVKSPLMTGQWEARLAQIQRGSGELESFMRDIETYVCDVVKRVRTEPPSAHAAPPRDDAPPLPFAFERERAEPQAPTPPGELLGLLRRRFRFESFRPFQEEVCRSLTSGSDALLVMPTGAGKSLCYQLPGLARAGTTLVVSPLIALMDDQVAKLQAQGLRAERIHSGPRARGIPGRAPRVSGREARLPVHRPRAARRAGLSREARAANAGAGRGRRGALHLAVGARLPARVPHAARTPAGAPPRADHRADRDGDSDGPARHRRAARHRQGEALHPRLPAHEHRDRAGRGQAVGARHRDRAPACARPGAVPPSSTPRRARRPKRSRPGSTDRSGRPRITPACRRAIATRCSGPSWTARWR